MSKYLVAVREEIAFEYEVEVEAESKFEALRKAEVGPDEWLDGSDERRGEALSEARGDLEMWSLGFQAQAARKEENDDADPE